MASIAYSRFGRTVAQYDELNTDLDNSVNDNNHIAAFAASVQFTNEVNVVSKGTPRPRTTFT